MPSSERRWNNVPESPLFPLGLVPRRQSWPRHGVCEPSCCGPASGFCAHASHRAARLIGLCKKKGNIWPKHSCGICLTFGPFLNVAQTWNASCFRHDIPGHSGARKDRATPSRYLGPSGLSRSRCLSHGGRGNVEVLEVRFENGWIDGATCFVRSVSFGSTTCAGSSHTDGSFGGERRHGGTSQWKRLRGRTQLIWQKLGNRLLLFPMKLKWNSREQNKTK